MMRALIAGSLRLRLPVVALSVILMAIVICLTAIQFRFVERKVHYA